MKKYIIWTIILVLVFCFFQILNIWNTAVSKWKYIIQKWDTISLIPKRFWLDINPTLYKIWLKISWPSIILKAWTYSINSNISLNELLSKSLKTPDSLDQEITILPGWNIFDIDEYLSNRWTIDKWELINLSSNIPMKIKDKYAFLKSNNSLEWFLYPDTYRVNLWAKIEDIVKVALDEFGSKIYYKLDINWDYFYNKAILASIVQKEERSTENQPIVAGILLKRLEENIALWADATVCYEYQLTSKACTPQFIWEKIHIKSSYNTRNQLWLPPTPISNFTKETFDAANNPQSSDYYYYLHDNEWYIHYAKTLDEHVKNKNLYLK